MWVQRPWQEIIQTTWFGLAVPFHIVWDSVYMPPMGLPPRCGDASYLGER